MGHVFTKLPQKFSESRQLLLQNFYLQAVLQLTNYHFSARGEFNLTRDCRSGFPINYVMQKYCMMHARAEGNVTALPVSSTHPLRYPEEVISLQ